MKTQPYCRAAFTIVVTFSILTTTILRASGEPVPCPAPTQEAAARSPEVTTAPKSGHSDLQLALGLERAFAHVADRVFPSVVTVTAYVKDDAVAKRGEPKPATSRAWITAATGTGYPGYKSIGSGSGIVFDDAGHVVTCRHLLVTRDGQLADLVEVEDQNRVRILCGIVSVEPTLNIAVVEPAIAGEQHRFAPATFATEGLPRIGHWSIAVGDPNGPVKVFDPGVVTALPDRDCYQENMTATYIHTSARCHLEAYGGPLVDIQGRVLGMLVPRDPGRRSSHYELEVALPSDVLVNLTKVLIEKGSKQSPWLGFAVMSYAELMTERGPDGFRALSPPPSGIYLEAIFDPSPASRAGLQIGDFLVGLAGQPIRSPLEFQRLLYLSGVGTRVEIEVHRSGETFRKTIVIEERPAEATFR